MMIQKFFACSKNLPICEHTINIFVNEQKVSYQYFQDGLKHRRNEQQST